MHDEPADPFGTAALRKRVLDAWAASPARLREDANAEEDYALGGYRDRVVVELAQNAADAAVRGGVAGRLRLTLRGATLTAANTGAPLDATGVEALCTLRASGKRGDDAATGTVGRFGVGFAAVVAVSDSPRIRSATGTVCWSRDRTRELAAAIPALAGELTARSGHVPVLRLPFACADCPPGTGTGTGADETAGGTPGDEYASEVELPLRDDAAVSLVARLLAETGPALLLALPALTEVVIETEGGTRVLTAGHAADAVTISIDGAVSEWRVASADGRLDPALLADRPTEERARTSWSVRWAVPVRAALSAATQPTATGRLPAGTTAVVHAPTPTDEPLSLPALLLASFPLGPDRRHVAPGPLTGFLIARAAETYAALLPRLAPGPALLDLVPGPAGHGELDARLGRAIAALLPDVPFLPAAAGPAGAEARGAEDQGTGAGAGTRGTGAYDAGTYDAGMHDAGAGAPRRPDAGLLLDLDTTPSPAERVPRVRPRDAVLLTARAPGLAAWLARVLPHLIGGPVRHPAYAVLGVRRLPLAELADMLASAGRDPAWWRGLYAALAGLPADELAELGALPVPLADGRLVRGARGVLLPGPGLEHPGRLAVLGLRVAHPAAAHPLLARLGAVEATPRRVLDDPMTRAAVANSYDSAVEAGYDDESPQRLADAVLGLVTTAQPDPGEYPYLADLALPGADGDWYPAGELLLPGSPLAEVVADDAPFGTVSADFARRYGPATLTAAGVLSSFTQLTAADVELDESAIDLDLDGAQDWAADTRASLRRAAAGEPPAVSGLPPVAVEVTAVRDLELVDPGRWPQAIELLTRPPLRAALTEPVRVRMPGGRHADVPSYTAWWLRRHLTLGGRRPGDLRAPDSDPLLAGLYDEIGPGPAEASGKTAADAAQPARQALARVLADPVIARALGVRTSLAALLAEPGGADDLLRRLGDPARPVTRPQLRALWSALASAATPAVPAPPGTAADTTATAVLTPDDVAPPDRIRAVRGDTVVVADADDVLVLDVPDLWPLLSGEPLVLAPHRLAPVLADLLDLPLASEEVPGAVKSAGRPRAVPAIARTLLTAAPASYQAHDRLVVDGTEVAWRYLDGVLHAATPAGLAHGLAWATDRWHDRHLLTALLTAPGETARLLAEADLSQ